MHIGSQTPWPRELSRRSTAGAVDAAAGVRLVAAGASSITARPRVRRVRASMKSRCAVCQVWCCMNDSNSMRALVRRTALRGGDVRLTSAQVDVLVDELACSGATLGLPWGFRADGCVGVVDGRRIILDDSTSAGAA